MYARDLRSSGAAAASGPVRPPPSQARAWRRPAYVWAWGAPSGACALRARAAEWLWWAVPVLQAGWPGLPLSWKLSADVRAAARSHFCGHPCGLPIALACVAQKRLGPQATRKCTHTHTHQGPACDSTPRRRDLAQQESPPDHTHTQSMSKGNSSARARARSLRYGELRRPVFVQHPERDSAR